MLCHAAIEAPPFRPPARLLGLLTSERMAGRDVVDLRPTVDAAACYPRLARSVQALVHTDNDTFCEELERHAAERHGANFSAACHRDFHRPEHLPDGDIFVWWQMQKFWSTGAILAFLRARAEANAIRPNAVAMVLFDMTQWRDAAEFQAMKRDTTWWHEVAFDERQHCLSRVSDRHKPLCTTRACGSWIAASFPLHGETLKAGETRADKLQLTPDLSHGAAGVPGHAEGSPNCSAAAAGASK
jgi:hypothetical protein